MIIRVLGGFLMALADSVPGVSGGTIAFIMGIYDEFINSLNNIISKDATKRKTAFAFLVKMGCGWVVGMASASLVINAVFEAHIYAISSLFMGFILFAIPLIIKEEMASFKGHYGNFVFLIIGVALVAGITYFAQDSFVNGVSLKWGELTWITGIYIFFCAMIAISAMVLPGISGSSLLLVFGVYQAVMTAISEFIKLDFSYFVGLCVFGFGVLAGIITVVRGLKVVLEKWRPAMMYLIIGMMIGSFYAIIMGPTSLKNNPQPAMSLETFDVLFFIIGGVVIIGLQVLKDYLIKKENL